MLDSETKRHIDAARDVLVGKVPDPKAQVEQITTALIYKFMDDMDRDAQGLGGKPSFFVNGYEKYAWTRLLDPRMGGQERLNLYAEALTLMSQNPHLPQLFRDIFKDAFLPYRDPATLNLFLKEISVFNYDHSENLGDAFEYLLSVLSSQGDAGQFRTPRHIIDFMVNVIDPRKNETMLDPACGTAGFLISAYRHIVEANAGHPLTPDEKKRLADNLVGYDISPDMVRLSLVNMYLHSFPSPHIYEYDTLTSEDRWDDKFDILMANPPFMTPKGGIRPHKRYQVEANRSEVLFVDYIAEHLKPHGRAAVIVPEGIIFQSANAYKLLRKSLVESWGLWAVVSLPAGVFQPYSGVKTSILFLDTVFARTANDIVFAKVQNDGFDLGAQRRPIESNDLPAVQTMLQAWHSGARQDNPLAQRVSRDRIAESGDYNLTGDRYREAEVAVNAKWPMVELEAICEINPRKAELSSVDRSLSVSFIPMEDIGTRQKTINSKRRRTLGEVFKGYTYFRDNDVLLAKVTPCFENGKSGIATELINGIGFGSSELHVIRPGPKVLAGFIYPFVSSDLFVKQGIPQMTGTGGLQRLPASFLQHFRIPLPPLDIQQRIVDELDRYQRIIDGANQVIANWRPAFDIDPAWPLVKVGEICDVNPEAGVPTALFGNAVAFTYLDIASVSNGTGIVDYGNVISTDNAPSRARRIVRTNDVLLSTVRPNLKAFTLLRNPPVHTIASTGFAVLRPKEGIRSDFLIYMLFDDHVVDQMTSRMGKGSYPSINQSDVQQLLIPLPSLDVQQRMAAQIEQEQQAVEGCRTLVSTYEAKIAATVARLWGLEPDA